MKQANYQRKYQPKTLSEAVQIIANLQHDLQRLQQQVALLLHDKFGHSSEKQPAIAATESAAAEPQPEEPEPVTEVITYTRRKNKSHRQIPDNLARVRIEYTLPDLTCPCGCGRQLYKIGEVITEQLEVIPAKIFVLQHVRFKYAGCLHQDKVITQAMPNQPIDKGFAGPGLLADVLIKKYDDHLPLYRQAEILERHDIKIARSTLGDWVMQCADLLQPLVAAMKPTLLASPKLHTDDTTVPVLTKQGATKTGRIWVYCGCQPDCVIYEYTTTRQQKWAAEFLKDYQGYLQADAFPGYDPLYHTKNIIEVACMAHARRKFHEIVKVTEKITGASNGIAHTAISYIGQLYQIETKIRDLDAEHKRAWRKKLTKPILKNYKRFLLTHSKVVLPKSPIGSAINYTLNNWVALTRYLGNGMLDIDNNRAERLMKPIAIGRKNYLFAGSDRGGHAAATIYSLIESCKLNNINPYDYLRDVLTKLPNTKNCDIQSLLPYIWQPQAAK